MSLRWADNDPPPRRRRRASIDEVRACLLKLRSQGWTVTRLADELGTSRAQIHRLLDGGQRRVNRRTVQAVRRLAGLDQEETP